MSPPAKDQILQVSITFLLCSVLNVCWLFSPVLELILRSTVKGAALQPVKVRGIEQADKNPKAVTSWINRFGDLHRLKPAAHVNYTKPMPEIEALMQEWPPEFEQLLEKVEPSLLLLLLSCLESLRLCFHRVTWMLTPKRTRKSSVLCWIYPRTII
jgi:hypothetical protein